MEVMVITINNRKTAVNVVVLVNRFEPQVKNVGLPFVKVQLSS